MLLDGLDVVLVRTRFPENIGMAARACANMGCPHLSLVTPERWNRDKAAPLATRQGEPLLDNIALHDSLADAVAESCLVLGTTARTGGWRRALLGPEQAATEIAANLAAGRRVSLVFGPEDKGLANAETSLCHKLVTIPVAAEASSLNLAQAVLLLLHACANAVRSVRYDADLPSAHEQIITAAESERLMDTFKQMLLALDYLHGDNPEYFFLPWRRLFARASLRRHEYDALMGLCRQVRHKLKLHGEVAK